MLKICALPALSISEGKLPSLIETMRFPEKTINCIIILEICLSSSFHCRGINLLLFDNAITLRKRIYDWMEIGESPRITTTSWDLYNVARDAVNSNRYYTEKVNAVRLYRHKEASYFLLFS